MGQRTIDPAAIEAEVDQIRSLEDTVGREPVSASNSLLLPDKQGNFAGICRLRGASSGFSSVNQMARVEFPIRESREFHQ